MFLESIPDKQIVVPYLSKVPTRKRGLYRPHFDLGAARLAFNGYINMDWQKQMAAAQRAGITVTHPSLIYSNVSGDWINNYTTHLWGTIFKWDEWNQKYIEIESVPEPTTVHLFDGMYRRWDWDETRPWVLEKNARKAARAARV